MNSFLPQKDVPGFAFNCLNTELLKQEEFDSYPQEFNSSICISNQKASITAESLKGRLKHRLVVPGLLVLLPPPQTTLHPTLHEGMALKML